MHGIEVETIGGPPDSKEVAWKAHLVRYAQEKRFAIERDGFVFGGIRIATDDHAIVLLSLACETLADDELAPFIDNGINYGSFNGATLRLMRKGLAQFVAQSFDVLGALLPKIYSGEIATTQQIDEANWPA